MFFIIMTIMLSSQALHSELHVKTNGFDNRYPQIDTIDPIIYELFEKQKWLDRLQNPHISIFEKQSIIETHGIIEKRLVPSLFNGLK